MSNAKKVSSLMGQCSYHEDNKAAFKRSGMGLLREVVKLLGLAKGTYALRYNAGGIAVSGECILRAENVYVQVCADIDFGVLVRTCNGRTGDGANCWYSWRRLEADGAKGLADFVEGVRAGRLGALAAVETRLQPIIRL